MCNVALLSMTLKSVISMNRTLTFLRSQLAGEDGNLRHGALPFVLSLISLIHIWTEKYMQLKYTDTSLASRIQPVFME